MDLSKFTIPSLIKHYLKIHGISKKKDIIDFILKIRPDTSAGSISVVMSHEKNKSITGLGSTWNIKENTLEERKERLTYMLIKLCYYYQSKLKDNDVKCDIRLEGISFDNGEACLMNDIYLQNGDINKDNEVIIEFHLMNDVYLQNGDGNKDKDFVAKLIKGMSE